MKSSIFPLVWWEMDKEITFDEIIRGYDYDRDNIPTFVEEAYYSKVGHY